PIELSIMTPFTSCSLFTYFKIYTYYSVLYSLPTRRSSDLKIFFCIQTCRVKVQHFITCHCFFRISVFHSIVFFVSSSHFKECILRQHRPVHFKTVSVNECKTEEHTSELQSRFDFVCSLLL